MGAHAEVARRGDHGSAPALGVSARGVPCMRPFLSDPTPGSDHLCNQAKGDVLLGLLQAGLISSDITLLTRSNPGNLATWPNSHSWRCQYYLHLYKAALFMIIYRYLQINHTGRTTRNGLIKMV